MTSKASMPPQKSRTLSSHIACRDCALYPVCEPTTIGNTAFDIAEQLLLKKHPVKAGDIIYHEADRFESLYALTSGSAKEECLSKNGEKQIVGFKLKGELAGQNAIATGHYPHTLTALEDSTLCVLPFHKLLDSANALPPLAMQIIKLLSIDSHHEAKIRQSLMTAKTAEEKVRAFISNIAQRHIERNLNSVDIRLSMSRTDIADYLGITKETLSRSLTLLQQKDLIESSGKNIHIIDLLRL